MPNSIWPQAELDHATGIALLGDDPSKQFFPPATADTALIGLAREVVAERWTAQQAALNENDAEAARLRSMRLAQQSEMQAYEETVVEFARNPRRPDRRAGSFKVNLGSGLWGDFATGDTGGDLISLAAYLFSLSQREAALRVAEMIGVDPHE